MTPMRIRISDPPRGVVRTTLVVTKGKRDGLLRRVTGHIRAKDFGPV